MLFNALTFATPNLSVLLLMFFSSFCLLPQASDKPPFAGKWEGRMNDQPAMEITIKSTGGEISGTIGFYFQERGADGKWHAKDKYEATLLSPKVTDKSLTFEVAHHKTHDSPELGPNVKFRMELTEAGEAVLHRVENQQEDAGLKLTRVREAAPN